ncbi:hypothetical protein F4808DRAFT_214716 [Astrocystis sublimbata]|nr:hypothetical protein F4808DRAFT_214716 [Astrocystis sublimbata]
MPSVPGSIKSVDDNKFTATFVIDDIEYHFRGSFSPNVQEFTASNSTLEYDDVGNLTSSRQWNGKIGENDIAITIVNGPKIKGNLGSPISPATLVSGSGSWSQSF